MANPNDPLHEQVSILGPTLRFKGELRADEGLMIKGHVEGSITHSQYVTVGREGHVKAKIHANIIAIEGTVDGDLSASTSVSVADSAQVTGDICAPSVSIVEGARFNGTVIMESGKPARAGGESDVRTSATSTQPRGSTRGNL